VDQLRGAVGHLAACLLELAQLCRASHSKPEQQLELLARLFRIIPDRRAAQVLLNTHGAIAWAGTFGQSPYSDFTYVLCCAVDGHGLMPGPTANQREMHGALLDAYATPAARARWALDRDQLERRYPRLLRHARRGNPDAHGGGEHAAAAAAPASVGTPPQPVQLRGCAPLRRRRRRQHRRGPCGNPAPPVVPQRAPRVDDCLRTIIPRITRPWLRPGALFFWAVQGDAGLDAGGQGVLPRLGGLMGGPG
jgi:hypothetical protein